MTENELGLELKCKNLSGMYFFYGDEDYMKKHRLGEIRRLVVGEDESFATFNCFELSFGDGELDLGALSDAFLAPPMMAPRKLISITLPSLDDLKEKERSALIGLLSEQAKNDYGDTVVVLRVGAGGFDPGSAKRPSSLLTALSKFMKCVDFAYQSEPRLIRWMARHLSDYGVELPMRVGQLIIEMCGRSMFRLIGEVRKIGAYTAFRGASEVSEADVLACVIRNEEDEAFRLANCILEGNITEALKSLNIKIRKREDPVVVLSQITRTFSELAAAAAFIADGRDKADFASSMKMSDYRAGLYYRAAKLRDVDYFTDAMERCRDADKLVKLGVGYPAIERLICGK